MEADEIDSAGFSIAPSVQRMPVPYSRTSCPALEFGHFLLNLLLEANPEGWQKVASGRQGQGETTSGRPRRGAGPRRHGRSNHRMKDVFSFWVTWL